YRPRRSWTRRETEKSGYWPEGRYSFLEGEGGAKLLGNAVPDPVAVPPLDGIDGQAMKQNREMQVVASRQPGLAREAQSVSRPDRLPLRDAHRGKVPVEGHEPKAVVENNGVAIYAEILGQRH